MHVALLSDIVIISIIVIITLMIYRDMKFLLSPIPRLLQTLVKAGDYKSFSGNEDKDVNSETFHYI